jgi:hypothetical protein
MWVEEWIEIYNMERKLVGLSSPWTWVQRVKKRRSVWAASGSTPVHQTEGVRSSSGKGKRKRQRR